MYLYSNLDPEAAAKLSVNGALSLYLNFINMFQMLISLLGDRR
jgi:FtsH-binding integral membrane protein